MNKVFFFLVMSVTLLACRPTMEKVPSGIIKPEKFTEIMLDIRLAEAHQKILRQKGQYEKELVDSSYQRIYMHHEVSEEEVVESYAFYIDHPEWMEKLTADVIERLNKMEE